MKLFYFVSNYIDVLIFPEQWTWQARTVR